MFTCRRQETETAEIPCPTSFAVFFNPVGITVGENGDRRMLLVLTNFDKFITLTSRYSLKKLGAVLTVYIDFHNFMLIKPPATLIYRLTLIKSPVNVKRTKGQKLTVKKANISTFQRTVHRPPTTLKHWHAPTPGSSLSGDMVFLKVLIFNTH